MFLGHGLIRCSALFSQGRRMLKMRQICAPEMLGNSSVLLRKPGYIVDIGAAALQFKTLALAERLIAGQYLLDNEGGTPTIHEQVMRRPGKLVAIIFHLENGGTHHGRMLKRYAGLALHREMTIEGLC